MVRRCRRRSYQGHGGPAEENGERSLPTTGDLTGDLTAALHAARHGEEAGFVAVYRDVQPRLLRYATVLVGRNNAEDVTAEAWLQISRDLHRFTGDIDRFRGWSATIVHHRAMDVCRATRPPPDRPRHPTTSGTSPSGPRTPRRRRSTRCPPTWRSR